MIEVGEGRFAHPSGGLWLAEEGTLLVADPHLGYAWAQRRRGELGLLGDVVGQAKLLQVVEELGPEQLVLLGDIVHAPKPGPEERALIEETMAAPKVRTRVQLVRGNHDRGLWKDFGWKAPTEFRIGQVVAVHRDCIPMCPDGHLVMGHFHPAWSIEDAAGARRRLPVFVVTPKLTVLPAFSPYAGGYNLRIRPWPAELAELLANTRPRLFATTGARVVELRRSRPKPTSSDPAE